ncbi:MAG TPA: hypothetical protein VEA41_15665 [Salinarimonas sp.]|nr:hypothetical protein [Salinarimonas sp.]
MSIRIGPAPLSHAPASSGPAIAAAERIEPLASADIPQVASLFVAVFEHRETLPSPDLAAYLARVFLQDADAALPSLVARQGERVVGFVGRVPLRFALADRAVTGALASTLMVNPRLASPLTGARLVRAFLSGPQSFSVGETASEVSEAMWRSCGGRSLGLYSLDWIRLLNPAAFALATASARIPGLGRTGGLARAIDGALRARAGERLRRWTHDGTAVIAARAGAADEAIDPDDLAALAPAFVLRFPLRPAWAPETISAIVRDGARKARFGEPMHRVVRDRRGAPIGAFVMHGGPGRTGRVLQIFAAEGATDIVVDLMLARGAAAGLAALRGRAQPWQIDALAARRCVFHKSLGTVVHSRDAAVLEAFARGAAFFNGYAGESWMRLTGDMFEA